MTTHQNGQPAPYGMYISTRPVDFRFVGANGETLEGRAPTYHRIPSALAIALSPAFGAIFVFAFPVVVLAAALLALVARVNEAAAAHAWLAQARFVPAASYLSGGAGSTGGEAPAELADLLVEVRARRARE